MANVSLDNRCRPTVDITIVGPKGEMILTAVIDTGFDGFLSAPSNNLDGVGFPNPNDAKATGTFTLADNSQISVELCAVTVRIDGEEQMGMCVVASPDSEPLFG